MPNEPIHFKRENGRVTLNMSEEDWQSILVKLGMAVTVAARDGYSQEHMEFLQRLNRENEAWPKEVNPDAT